MLDIIKTIFRAYPFIKWISILGVFLLFFGGDGVGIYGLYILLAVIIFIFFIYFATEEMNESDEEYRRRKNQKD